MGKETEIPGMSVPHEQETITASFINGETREERKEKEAERGGNGGGGWEMNKDKPGKSTERGSCSSRNYSVQEQTVLQGQVPIV